MDRALALGAAGALVLLLGACSSRGPDGSPAGPPAAAGSTVVLDVKGMT